MRLSLLEEFIELGNCLSFSKASARLHISQPALSMHISKLEQDIGVTLISRNRPISLTPAGKLLYANASKMLALMNETIEGCRILDSSAEKGSLTIKMDYAYEPVKGPFKRLVSSFAKLHPSIEVNTVVGGGRFGNVPAGLSDERINVWFFSTSFEEQLEAHRASTAAESIFIAETPLTLWMRPHHHLAQKDLVSMADVTGQRYPMPMGEQFAEIRDAAMGIIDAYGAKPTFRNVLAHSFIDFLFEVEDDEVFLMAEHPLDADRDGFVCRPFDPAIRHRNYLMVKADEENPALRLFFDYVRENWAPSDNRSQ